MNKMQAKTADSRGSVQEKQDDAQSLTARQKEILKLVAQGHTNREIGDQLDISVIGLT